MIKDSVGTVGYLAHRAAKGIQENRDSQGIQGLTGYRAHLEAKDS